MSSFVLSRFPVPESVYFSVQRELAGLNDKQRRLILHVLVSNVLNLNKIVHLGLSGYLDLGVELPIQWIAAHFTARFRVENIDSSLLSWAEYSTDASRCRSFLASEALRSAILDWAPADAEAAASEKIVNLFDGEPYQVQAPAQRQDGVYSPKLVREAIKAIESCPFDYQALEAHLAMLRQNIPLAPTDAHREHRRLAHQNDQTCANRIRAGCQLDRSGMARYSPEYRTSYTGRIVEVGGGAQSCSRAMKAALFDGISNLRNYDLKRAQAFMLLQELEDAGLPRSWVQTYVHDANANETRSAALGISKDGYKRCLYATIMGATHAELYDTDKNEMFAVLMKEADADRRRAKELTTRVYAALKGLKVEVKAWRDYLMTAPDCPHVDPTWPRLRTLKNACGQHFRLDREAERADVLARRAAAFVLQGQEASFIHRLTVLGAANGFAPVSNQHDGLVVIGDIPQSAIDEAAKAAGLRYAAMETKPFI